MTRKFIALLVVLVLILGAFATVSAQEEDTVIGVMLPTVNGDFYDGMVELFGTAAGELGVTVTVMDSEYDLEVEAENIAALIEDDIDALLFTPVDAVESLSVIEAANEAEVPVFLIGENAELSAAEVEVVSTVGIDNEVGGQVAAEYVCSSIEDGGTVLELVETFEDEESTLAEVYQARSEAFAAYLDEECSGFTVETFDVTGMSSREMLRELPEALTEGEVVSIFATNDLNILSAVRPVVRAQVDVLLVGFNATEDTLGAIQLGSLNGVVSSSGSDLGMLGLETALAYLDGEEVESNLVLNPLLINAEALTQVRGCIVGVNCDDN